MGSIPTGVFGLVPENGATIISISRDGSKVAARSILSTQGEAIMLKQLSCGVALLLAWAAVSAAGELNVGDPAPKLEVKEFVKVSTWWSSGRRGAALAGRPYPT